jgi:hypothetical protein
MYACAPDIGFYNHQKYACDSMGIYDNLIDCVTRIDSLHNSFGWSIYPINIEVCRDITLDGGMSGTRTRSGYLVTGERIQSFNVEQV